MSLTPIQSFSLDRRSKISLSRQLYESLRVAIIEGYLKSGTRLPSTRELANELSVSRTVTVEAYDTLKAEGYIFGKIGSGNFVADFLPELENPIIPSQTKKIRSISPERISKRAKSLESFDNKSQWAVTDGNIRPFVAGIPSLGDFPYHEWTRSIRKQMNSLPRSYFAYSDHTGYQPLRESIAEYLGSVRAVRVDPSQVIIINGSQEAFSLIGFCLADPGEVVWIEDPTYPGAALAYNSQSLKVTPCPLDEEGIIINRTRKIINPKLIHVSPSHQYPTGITMSLERRLELLKYANENRCWIVEDDYDSDYRFSGQPLCSLQGIDRSEKVIYIGTFSKVLLPSLRIGYLVVPPSLVSSFASAKRSLNRGSNILLQATLHDFMDNGQFSRHLRRMRILYMNRQAALLNGIRKHLSDVMQVTDPDAGLHLVGWLTGSYSEKEIVKLAGKVSVSLVGVNSFCQSHKYHPGVLIGYAGYTEKQIESAIIRLRDILNK